MPEEQPKAEGGAPPELPSYISSVPEARPHIHETRRFPAEFLWGTATSSHQVEGNCRNDWSEWEQGAGRIADGNVSGAAADHYNRYEEDFDLAVDLGTNAHRLSIEWSRIEPREGEWDYDEILHYRRVLEACRRRGIKTMVTLWHYTLPVWFQERGGWSAPRSVSRFVRYSDFVAQELGDLVDYWCTINEPMIYLAQSYGSGAWPPGRKNVLELAFVMGRLLSAHRLTYRMLHSRLDTEYSRCWVGIAKNVVTFEPYRRYALSDSLFIMFLDLIYNRLFFSLSKRYHDYIGVNYYFHYRVKYLPSDPKHFFFEVHTENREVSDLGWEIYPPGIFDAIMSMTRYNKPIFITENGLASADDGKRPRALVGMLKEVYHAIKAGADVRGYFHWSLLDNFEWEKGYRGRFGLIAVDFATQKRTPRRSAYVYREICRENGIPHRLLKFMGHGVRW